MQRKKPEIKDEEKGEPGERATTVRKVTPPPWIDFDLIDTELLALGELPEPLPQVLVVTTGDDELIAVLRRLAPLPNHNARGRLAVAQITLTVGALGGRVVLVCQTKQSNADTFLVINTLLGSPQLKDAIKLVFAIGFAFAAHPTTPDSAREGQLMGDVLVADKCIHAARLQSPPI